MRRAGVIVALSALLGMLGIAAMAAPALTQGPPVSRARARCEHGRFW